MKPFISISIFLILTACHAGLWVENASAAANKPPRILTGVPAFGKQVLANNVDQTHAVVVADLNGDNHFDVVATDYVTGTVRWFENDGLQNFLSHDLDSNLPGAYPAAVADLDGDGDVDVLACGYLANTVVWYENDNAGNFLRHDVDTSAPGAHSVVGGDMDGDGDLDLLATNQDEGAVLWYENDGTLGFTRHTIDGGALKAKRAEFGDLDGDGDQDVIACSFELDEVAWYENDGAETFVKHVITTAARGAYYVAIADMDSDGDLDILSASQLDHTVAWYENDGSGNFVARDIDTNAEGARTVQAVDMNGDGKMDVLAASVGDNTVGWYQHDGNGTFTPHAVDLNAPGAYGIYGVDMNGDHYPDVLSASRDNDAVVLHIQYRKHQAVLTQMGGTLPISANLLHTTDENDSPARITYTLTAGPSAGAIMVGGAPIIAGDSFTQQDINADRVEYVHDGSPAVADEFEFTVADSGQDNIAPAQGKFSIHLGDPLRAHWPLDEPTGSIAADIIGTNDGFLSSGPIWQSDGGISGGALWFDGVDDRVEIESSEMADGPGMTLAMWIRPETIGSDGRLISMATGVGEQDHLCMVSTYAGNQLRLRLRTRGVTSTLITPYSALELNQWTHVVCTYDKREMRIYADGVLLAALPKDGAIDYDPAVGGALGNQPVGAGNNPFAGLIDEVRIYNRALLPAEIVDLLTAGAVSGVGENDEGRDLPREFRLLATVPNPFNPQTTISFEQFTSGLIRVSVYDVDGSLVRDLAHEYREMGRHEVVWDGRDGGGRRMASGTYVVQVAADNVLQTRKLMMIK